jgi:hypothetical protein
MWALLIPLLLTATGDANRSPVLQEKVDLIEVNHFHDETGRLVLDQLIFYAWSNSQSRYVVRAWRMIRHPHQLPHRSPNGEGYECLWRDDQIFRSIRAPQLRETWTQIDPERANRAFLPQDQRQELAQKLSPSVSK